MSDNRWADVVDEQYLNMIARIVEAEERQVELLEQIAEHLIDEDDPDDSEAES